MHEGAAGTQMQEVYRSETGLKRYLLCQDSLRTMQTAPCRSIRSTEKGRRPRGLELECTFRLNQTIPLFHFNVLIPNLRFRARCPFISVRSDTILTRSLSPSPSSLPHRIIAVHPPRSPTSLHLRGRRRTSRATHPSPASRRASCARPNGMIALHPVPPAGLNTRSRRPGRPPT